MSRIAFENKRDLCLKKLNNETDLDWLEIKEELGLECSADHLRKISYGIREYHNYIQDVGIENVSKEQLDKLNEKIIELKKEKILLSDLKQDLNRKIRKQARYEDMIALAERCSSNLENNKPLIPHELPTYTDNGVLREGVMLLSDWHLGAEIDNFINKYNLEIFKKRLCYLTKRMLEIKETHNLQKLHLVFAGDLICGGIHNINRLESRETITQQIILVAEAISELSYILSKHIPVVSISICDGNHERVFQKKEDNTKTDNFTNLIREIVKIRTEHIPNIVYIENKYDNNIIALNVCENNIVAVHGDKEKVNNAISNLSSLLEKNIDYLLLGHWHSGKEFTIGKSETIVNGSLMGTDEYAKNLRLSSLPMQKMMIFSKEFGRECTYNITIKD